RGENQRQDDAKLNALGRAELFVTALVDARCTGFQPSHVKPDMNDRDDAGNNAEIQSESLGSQRPKNGRVRRSFEQVFKHFYGMKDPNHYPRDKYKGKERGEQNQEV